MWVPQWVEIGGVVPDNIVEALCDADGRGIDKGLLSLATNDVELVWWGK